MAENARFVHFIVTVEVDDSWDETAAKQMLEEANTRVVNVQRTEE